MADVSAGGLLVAVEDHVLVVHDLTVGAEPESDGVEVVVGPGGGARVPAEPDGELGEGAAGFLGERDIAALGERNGHIEKHLQVLSQGYACLGTSLRIEETRK